MTFFREFLLNWKHTGAVAPSSRGLAKLVVETAGTCHAKTLLELGPGTGAFTEVLYQTLPKSSRYLGIDLNKGFIEKLKNRYPLFNFEAVAAQECNFKAFLGEEQKFDAIVSGLPWAAFPECLQVSILDQVLPWLKPGGTFVTFAYTGFHLLPAGQRFRNLLQNRSSKLDSTHTVWGNLPPAFVYQATA